MSQHRPVLVFRGGGYEGCFFEWNAILFKPGAPHQPDEVQPCVSGRAGKRVLDAAQNGLRAAVAAARNEGDWHLCTTPASWIKFDADFNKGFVRAVCKEAGRECRCDRCKKWFDPDEIVHTGYRGNGGIGVQFDDNHCQECADQEHDDYCAKHLWKYETLDGRVEAIQRHNEEHLYPVASSQPAGQKPRLATTSIPVSRNTTDPCAAKVSSLCSHRSVREVHWHLKPSAPN